MTAVAEDWSLDKLSVSAAITSLAEHEVPDFVVRCLLQRFGSPIGEYCPAAGCLCVLRSGGVSAVLDSVEPTVLLTCICWLFGSLGRLREWFASRGRALCDEPGTGLSV